MLERINRSNKLLKLSRIAAGMIDPQSIRRYAEGLIFRESGRIRNRFPMHPQCLEAADYIYSSLKNSLIHGDIERIPTEFEIKDDLQEIRFDFENVVGSVIGAEDNKKVYIIGAYYDTNQPHSEYWWFDKFPAEIEGADNNASGAAIMLELARVFGEMDISRLGFDLQFIGFSNKELKFQDNVLTIIGTEAYANDSIAADDYFKDKSITVFLLDTVGYNPKIDRIEAAVLRRDNFLFNNLVKINKESDTGIILEKGRIPFFMPVRFEALKQFSNVGADACLFSESISFKNNRNYPGNKFINTPEDTIGRLNFEMMSKLAKLLAFSICRLQQQYLAAAVTK